MSPRPQIKSPCIKICVIEEGSGLCRGCGRTLEEIARWGSLTQEAREAVMQRLPARLSQLEGTPG
ncbi:DUF1289 domain-containing protein [Breoghania sp. JC706]|uniref:DUF1289 domain-containing protein n=1 Tax=Breoghania sp. JC706 TaxID=3117732 RepID=UPI00300986A1